MSEPRIGELTPAGRGAVSVLLVEGAGALERVSGWCGRALSTGVLAIARLVLDGEALDEALVVPWSKERVEVHLTGSPALVERLRAGGRPEAEGTSLEARAWRALGGAAAEEGARVLLDQAEGALRAALEELLGEGDSRLRAGLDELATRSAQARPALEPRRVVLAGEANAGKSTLFNLLVASERVITSDEAGTTRDAICEPALLGVWPVLLVDTAGVRDDVGEGDRAGLERAAARIAERARASADLVLWLRPPGAPPPPPPREGERRVVLASKVDLVGAGGGLALSVLAEPERARAVVERAFRECLGLPERVWSPGAAIAFDARSRAALDEARRGDDRATREKVRAMLEEGLAED